MNKILEQLNELELSNRNIKTIFHKLSELHQLQLSHLSSDAANELENLIEELDILCGLLEAENRNISLQENERVRRMLKLCAQLVSNK